MRNPSAYAWLMERAPGFADLTEDERSAITDFALLWSLFEARILDTEGSVARICAAVDQWRATGTLRAESYARELAYFQQRYFADKDFTGYFDGLHLRSNDKEELVRTVIDGTNDDERDRVAAVFIIAFRYRNNLFHGEKWGYRLHGQLDNFTNANTALMKALDQHGQL